MARRFSSSAVVSYFSGEDVGGLGEVMFPGSDDDLDVEPMDYTNGIANNKCCCTKITSLVQ